jgi:hypothetical protein
VVQGTHGAKAPLVTLHLPARAVRSFHRGALQLTGHTVCGFDRVP